MFQGVLKAGTEVLYWDDDPNGHLTLKGPVKVVRACGFGVLVELQCGGTVARFRVHRGDVEPCKK